MSDQLKIQKKNQTSLFSLHPPHPRPLPIRHAAGQARRRPVCRPSLLPGSLSLPGLPRSRRRPCPAFPGAAAVLVPDIARRSSCSQQGEAGARVRREEGNRCGHNSAGDRGWRQSAGKEEAVGNSRPSSPELKKKGSVDLAPVLAEVEAVAGGLSLASVVLLRSSEWLQTGTPAGIARRSS
jgi:hypothetical protein